ncbi:MAG: TonB-dependent siderophore receptor [Burkholderiaceae bacterium]
MLFARRWRCSFGFVAAPLALLTAQAWAQETEEVRTEEVRERTDGDASHLPAVEVRSPAWSDATTEGRDAYAATHATVGGKDATPVLEIPQSVSVITRQRIEDQNLQSVEEALREVTGVTVTPWNGATYQIRSRGYFLEPSYDGIPSFGDLNVTQQFDLAMFDRVEVLRGPSGLFQGSGQPGGTVNLVRRQGLAKFGGSATASVGSWSQYRAEASVGGPLNADGTLRSRLVVVGHDRDFYYDHAHGRGAMAYGTLDYDLSPRTTLSLYGAHQYDKENTFMGLPAHSDGRFLDVRRSTNPYPSWSRSATTTSMVAVELGHRWDSGWKLRGRYGRQTQDTDLIDGYPNSGIDVATGLAPYRRRGWDSRTTRDLLDVYVSGPFTLLGRRHEAVVGWNYGKHASDTLYGATDVVPGISFLDPDALPRPDIPPFVRGYSDETVQSGFYGQLKLSLTDAITLVTGARSSNFRTRSRDTVPGSPAPGWTAGARETGEVTPYAGVVVHVADNVTTYASYSDIFMPQTAREAGGRTLDPRVGKQIELGAKGSFLDGRLQASASVFRTRDENRSFPDTANPGFFLQAGKVEIKGWEAEISGNPTANLQMTLGYARLDTEYLSHERLAGTPFTLFEPRHSLKAYARYRFAGSPWSIGGGAHITSGLIGTGEAGLREQGGYGIASVQVGYRITGKTSLSLAVNNVFDRKYYARVGGLNSYNTYGEPRNLLLTLRTSL